MVIADSREKKNEHILQYFRSQNIPYKIQKMDEADYQVEGQDSIVIDRKKNLSELSRNLMNAKDHSRFWKEVRRCHQKGKKLYILCEHGGKIKSIQDVAGWADRYSGVGGRALMDEIYRIHISYGVEFVFCDKDNAGSKVIEILQGGE